MTDRTFPAWLVFAVGALALAAGVAVPLLVVLGRGHGVGFAAEALDARQPLRPEMVVLPPGVFWMGSPEGESGRGPDEHRRRVTIGEPGARTFAIGRTEVTQAQWRAVMGGDPSYFEGDDRPVERVTWYAALLYLNRLSQREGLSVCYRLDGCRGDPNDGSDELFTTDPDGAFVCDAVERAADCAGYRLPSEAEWEYAARAGTAGPTYAPTLNAIAWYDGNSGRRTHPVSRVDPEGKAPNPWKLYDMLGNVWEWTGGAYQGALRGHLSDAPVALKAPRDRVARGCGWSDAAIVCRAALRDAIHPAVRDGVQGFRPARTWPLAP